MNFITVLEELEDSDTLHLSRLIILLSLFSSGKKPEGINGLTKLAKLDFLLRYPVYLERSLKAKSLDSDSLQIKNYEKISVESSMVRYRYGPWDARHKRLINILVGKGIVTITFDRKRTIMKLTKNGLKIAEKISQQEEFSEVLQRAKVLKRHFDFTGNNLKKFIYDTFPEISNLGWGEEIPT